VEGAHRTPGQPRERYPGAFLRATLRQPGTGDDGANLCCNVYLDLNQVKAGLARSLEESTCSAIQDRLLAWRRHEAQASLEKFRASAPEGYALEASDVERFLADCFLAPISDQGLAMVVDARSAWPVPVLAIPAQSVLPADRSQLPGELPMKDAEREKQDLPDGASSTPPKNPAALESTGATGEVGQKPSHRPQPTRKVHQRLQTHRRRRASDHAFLGIPLGQYLGLVQWTPNSWGRSAAIALCRVRGVTAAVGSRTVTLVPSGGAFCRLVPSRGRPCGPAPTEDRACGQEVAARHAGLPRHIHVTHPRSRSRTPRQFQ